MRNSNNTKPFSALEVKVTTDPFLGILTFTSASTQASTITPSNTTVRPVQLLQNQVTANVQNFARLSP